MITAKEALELYDHSGAEVKRFLDTEVEKAVTDAAKSGKKSVFIHRGAHESYSNAIPLKIDTRAMEELKKLGFTVKFINDGEEYVPRGLANDYDGSGPKYINYGIAIGW